MNIALIKSYTDKPWRSPETYQLMEDSLSEKWHVESIATENPEILHSFLSELKREYGEDIFVFNVAEFLDEKNKEGFLPALLEKWDIAHLGSEAETIAIGLDKARTKALLMEQQIPTPKYFVASRGDVDYQDSAEKIGYPLIVKPLSEGGHIGIDEDSIVYDYAGLHKAIQRILDGYHQPAIVEAYITDQGMREFSVGIIEGETRLFTPVEIDYDSMAVDIAILSYEAAENDLERIKLVQGEKTRHEIIDLSERTFEAVGACDYSRIDIRMDHTGFYVLEINTMPGLGPHSFLPEAAKDIYALEYSQLIQNLAEVSISRQTHSLS
jgi:D-alanine-D-alanine ligase